MHSEQVNEIAAALAKAQGEFGAVKKDKTAKVKSDKANYEYAYADLASVIDGVRDALSKNAIAFTQIPGFNDKGAFVLVTKLIHSSGQWIAGEWPLPNQAAPQQMGSSLSYARRYSLCAVAGIATEDDDGTAAQQAHQRAQQRPASATARPTASASKPAETPHDRDTGEVLDPADDHIPGDEPTDDITSPWYTNYLNERGGMAWGRFIAEFEESIKQTKTDDDLTNLQSAFKLTLKRLSEQNGAGARAYDKLHSLVLARRASFRAAGLSEPNTVLGG